MLTYRLWVTGVGQNKTSGKIHYRLTQFTISHRCEKIVNCAFCNALFYPLTRKFFHQYENHRQHNEATGLTVMIDVERL